jgi:putative peptide zinc metalloprotease protein
VVIPNVNDLPGRFVKRGELIGYVLGATSPSVSVVVPQERIGLVRDHVEHVSLRTASRPDVAMRVLLQREVPSATDRLPSATLGRLGGGELATLPDDKEGLTLLKPAFQFDLDLPLDARSAHIGERVYVLFDHGREPLGMQWYRVLRQMFLGKFAV